MFSGGELPLLTRGWALYVLGPHTVHFYVRQPPGMVGVEWYKSLCGTSTAPLKLKNGQHSMFAGGGFPRCKHCLRRTNKKGSKAFAAEPLSAGQ